MWKTSGHAVTSVMFVSVGTVAFLLYGLQMLVGGANKKRKQLDVITNPLFSDLPGNIWHDKDD